MNEEDILYEMSNFRSNDTGLSSGLDVWVRTDLGDYGHNRYRVKIRKNRQWAAIYTVGVEPTEIKQLDNPLTTAEKKEVVNWIETYSSLIISLIDDKISTGDFVREIAKIRGM